MKDDVKLKTCLCGSTVHIEDQTTNMLQQKGVKYGRIVCDNNHIYHPNRCYVKTICAPLDKVIKTWNTRTEHPEEPEQEVIEICPECGIEDDIPNSTKCENCGYVYDIYADAMKDKELTVEENKKINKFTFSMSEEDRRKMFKGMIPILSRRLNEKIHDTWICDPDEIEDIQNRLVEIEDKVFNPKPQDKPKEWEVMNSRYNAHEPLSCIDNNAEGIKQNRDKIRILQKELNISNMGISGLMDNIRNSLRVYQDKVDELEKQVKEKG